MTRSFPVMLGLIAMLIATACGGDSSSSGAAEPDRLVPASANMIGQIQVSRILSDVDFTSLYSDAPKDTDAPEDFAALLETAKEETGVDFRNVDSAVIFGDVAQLEDYFGLIARGVFDQAQLLAVLEAEMGSPLTVITYGEIELHVGGETGDVPSVSFLSDDTLVVGTVTAIKDVIDVHIGDKPRLSGTVYDAFNDMGDPLVRVAVKVPADILDDLSQGSTAGLGLPIAMKAVQDLDVVSFSVDKAGDDVKIAIQLNFNNEGSATELSDILGGLISVGKGFAPTEDARNILDHLELSVAGSKLTILLQVAISDLQKAAEGLEGNLAPAPITGQ